MSRGVTPGIWGVASSSVYQVLSLPGAMLHTLHELFFLSPHSSSVYYFALHFIASMLKLREVK